METTVTGEGILLRTFSRSDTNHSTTAARIDGILNEDANGNLPNTEPSQTYKCLLVLAGFMMTFHVIGINSIYGLFQVRSLAHNHTAAIHEILKQLIS